MIKIEKNNKLFHIVYRLSDLKRIEREEVVPADNFIQLAALNMNKGKTFKPHQHIWKDGVPLVKAQESWVVIRGQVRVFYYDEDGQLLEEHTLYPGDVSITLHGGHNYLCEEDSLVYEYKTGPYTGQENDKVFL